MGRVWLDRSAALTLATIATLILLGVNYFESAIPIPHWPRDCRTPEHPYAFCPDL
jgi:hypothetical protein